MIETYHYTTGECLTQILKCGEARAATTGIHAREVAVVWFSRCPTFEPTARKGLVEAATGRRKTATLQEMEDFAQGLFRIVVDEAILVRWPELARVARIPSGTVRKLESSARAAGSLPWQWAGSVRPVPASAFVRVEQIDAESGALAELRWRSET